jgi:hypothetical protein
VIKLLGASALAITLSMSAAQAHHRHFHATHMAYSHHASGYRHLASRRGWRRYATPDNGIGSNYAEAGWNHDEGYARRPTSYAHTGLGPRPHAWCGWYARQLVGQDPGPSFNLARNWARWGHAASPGPGVMVVWPHHVGMITGRSPNGEWIVKSGNDGHATRERARSIAGAIAFRAG